MMTKWLEMIHVQRIYSTKKCKPVSYIFVASCTHVCYKIFTLLMI
jgi:hypothetical protein